MLKYVGPSLYSIHILWALLKWLVFRNEVENLSLIFIIFPPVRTFAILMAVVVMFALRPPSKFVSLKVLMVGMIHSFL